MPLQEQDPLANSNRAWTDGSPSSESPSAPTLSGRSWVPTAGALMETKRPSVPRRVARFFGRWVGRLTIGTVMVGTVAGMGGNLWQTRLASTGSIDLSKEAVAARAIDGSAMLPMTPGTFNRYAEAQAFAELSYKSDWGPQLAAWKKAGSPRDVLPDPRFLNTSFHPDTLGVYENNVSAMRVIEADYAGTRTLVISFSGSDDFLDFWRDSNGLGLLSGSITPKTSVQELQPGMDEALALIRNHANQYDRIVIAGHSLGGYLANNFANQLSRSLGGDAQSSVLKKTQLLSVNSLYLGEPEPTTLASIEHFREPLELTDLVGPPAFLRAPDSRYIVYVSGAPVADHALARQIEIAKLPLAIGALATIENGALFAIERTMLVKTRHQNANEGLRVAHYETSDGLKTSLPLSIDQSVLALGCSEDASAEQKVQLQHDWFARSPQAGIVYNASPFLQNILASENPLSSIEATQNGPATGRLQTGLASQELASSDSSPGAISEGDAVAAFLKGLGEQKPLNTARWKESQQQIAQKASAKRKNDF